MMPYKNIKAMVRSFDDNINFLGIIAGVLLRETLVPYMFIKKVKSKVSDHSRGWPEGSLFESYYTKV